MTFSEFKLRLWQLGSSDTPLIEIENYIKLWYDKVFMPTVLINVGYVVRCSLNNSGEIFKNVSRCSYPPDFILDRIKIQRCNYPGQQVFYCSMYTDTDFASTSLTTILETTFEHIKEEEINRLYVTMSRWELQRQLKFWALPFCKISCEKNRDMEQIRKDAFTYIKSNVENWEDTIRSLEFISELYADTKEKIIAYRITAAFYNYLLKRNPGQSSEFDGLIYPSANTEGAGVNIVLKKELVDSKVLVPSHVVMYAIQRIPNNAKNLIGSPVSDTCLPDINGNISFKYIS